MSRRHQVVSCYITWWKWSILWINGGISAHHRLPIFRLLKHKTCSRLVVWSGINGLFFGASQMLSFSLSLVGDPILRQLACSRVHWCISNHKFAVMQQRISNASLPEHQLQTRRLLVGKRICFVLRCDGCNTKALHMYIILNAIWWRRYSCIRIYIILWVYQLLVCAVGNKKKLIRHVP